MYMNLNGNKKYNTGDILYYLGKPYRIVRKPSLSARKGYVAMVGEEILIYGKYDDTEEIRAVLSKWYQEKAAAWIPKRIASFEKKIGVKCTKITLRNTKTRWGSCSSERHVMINWNLIMAPEEVLDYVVCHELCHILQMNHSKEFWALVALYMPDWKEQKEWLKENGLTLRV